MPPIDLALVNAGIIYELLHLSVWSTQAVWVQPLKEFFLSKPLECHGTHPVLTAIPSPAQPRAQL